MAADSEWRRRISVDPAVHHGDPCISGQAGIALDSQIAPILVGCILYEVSCVQTKPHKALASRTSAAIFRMSFSNSALDAGISP